MRAVRHVHLHPGSQGVIGIGEPGKERGVAAEMTDDPMHQCTEVQSAEPQSLREARRCGARKRTL